MSLETARSTIERLKPQNYLANEDRISQRNVGWSVRVGCVTMAYSDRDELLHDLTSYLKDPQPFHEVWYTVPGGGGGIAAGMAPRPTATGMMAQAEARVARNFARTYEPMQAEEPPQEEAPG